MFLMKANKSSIVNSFAVFSVLFSKFAMLINIQSIGSVMTPLILLCLCKTDIISAPPSRSNSSATKLKNKRTSGEVSPQGSLFNLNLSFSSMMI